MARGNWRNWDGRDGAESYRGQKVPTRPVKCLWCGWEWNTRVPYFPVCPKCNLTSDTARQILEHPEGHPVHKFKWGLRRKTMTLKGYYFMHPEELNRKKRQ